MPVDIPRSQLPNEPWVKSFKKYEHCNRVLLGKYLSDKEIYALQGISDPARRGLEGLRIAHPRIELVAQIREAYWGT